MTKSEMKNCPFCGETVICTEDMAAEEVCECPAAKHKREIERRYYKVRTALDNCCGADCGELYPELLPLSEETFTAVNEIAEMVCRELIGGVSLALPDGTSLRIAVDAVERKITIKRKEKVQ